MSASDPQLVDREGAAAPTARLPHQLYACAGVSKTFGSTRALKSVDLDLERGQVLGVLGHNGSGKSTLVGVLTGSHRPDAGAEAWQHGEKLSFPLSRTKIGVGVVAQDLGLIEGMTGLENFLISRRVSPTGHQRYGINWRSERRRAQRVFQSYGVEIDLRRPLEDLPLLQRALLAIVRCAEDLKEFGASPDRARHHHPWTSRRSTCQTRSRAFCGIWCAPVPSRRHERRADLPRFWLHPRFDRPHGRAARWRTGRRA